MPLNFLDLVNAARRSAGTTVSSGYPSPPTTVPKTTKQQQMAAAVAPVLEQRRAELTPEQIQTGGSGLTPEQFVQSILTQQRAAQPAPAPVQQPSATPPTEVVKTPQQQQIAQQVAAAVQARQAELAPEQIQQGGQGITPEQWVQQVQAQRATAQPTQTVQTTAPSPPAGQVATTNFLKQALLKTRPAYMAQATSDILDWFGTTPDGEYAWGQGKIIKQGLKATYVGPEGTYVFTPQSPMSELAKVPGVADWLAQNYGIYPGMYEYTVEPVQSPYFGPGPGYGETAVTQAGPAATTQPGSTAVTQPGSTATTQPGSSAATQPGSGGGFLDQLARLIEATLTQQQTQYASISDLIQQAIQSYETQRQLMQDPNYLAQLYASLSQAIRAGVEPYAGAARRQLYEQYMGMIPSVLNSLAARGILRSSETGRAMSQLGGNYLAGLASLETALANLLVPSITALAGFSGQQASASETTPRMLMGLLSLLPQGGLPGIGQYLSLLDLVSNVFV